MAELVTDLDHARYDRDRWMDDAMKAQQRLIEISADLAAEKQCARLNAECHTREIRALQDMVEAEAEARREAEGEVERLRSEIARLSEPKREVIAALTFGGEDCFCRQRPSGGCDLLGCPHRPGGNLTAPPPVPSSTKT